MYENITNCDVGSVAFNDLSKESIQGLFSVSFHSGDAIVDSPCFVDHHISNKSVLEE